MYSHISGGDLPEDLTEAGKLHTDWMDEHNAKIEQLTINLAAPTPAHKDFRKPEFGNSDN